MILNKVKRWLYIIGNFHHIPDKPELFHVKPEFVFGDTRNDMVCLHLQIRIIVYSYMICLVSPNIPETTATTSEIHRLYD